MIYIYSSLSAFQFYLQMSENWLSEKKSSKSGGPVWTGMTKRPCKLKRNSGNSGAVRRKSSFKKPSSRSLLSLWRVKLRKRKLSSHSSIKGKLYWTEKQRLKPAAQLNRWKQKLTAVISCYLYTVVYQRLRIVMIIGRRQESKSQVQTHWKMRALWIIISPPPMRGHLIAQFVIKDSAAKEICTPTWEAIQGKSLSTAPFVTKVLVQRSIWRLIWEVILGRNHSAAQRVTKVLVRRRP